ncbi:SAVED domain-containing protein [Actinomadura sp. 7K507]|uniref:SAVED domain-containing protein n=1 Tax=Actinomadura sp. 7K507 TaxID=2530365 RepID=UPI001043B366|nr:SAVED domain-containing protein [Actinomadura sp. 7K507]TDC87643.1 SAVED domain-containing protein [Actinomadura sp. 7K507]
MAPDSTPNVPRLSVVGAGTGGPSKAKRIITDGRGWIAVGSGAGTGFFVESVKSFATSDPDGRWWFVLGFVVGIALIAVGVGLERRRGSGARVGVVVTAGDPRNAVKAVERDEAAETYSREHCTFVLKAHMWFGEPPWTAAAVDALADETSAAVTTARRLTGEANRVDLVPTMPLPAAFRFGARLGHTHGSEIVVHAVRQRSQGLFFPATVLRNTATAASSAPPPLVVEGLETFDDGDPAVTALALDVQGHGARFTAPVRQACRQFGFGNLLLIRAPEEFLLENRETFTACVEQICRAWADAGLSDTARTGRYSAFLNGPVAISLAVGARLANNQPSRWTTYTFDDASSTYEPLV